MGLMNLFLLGLLAFPAVALAAALIYLIFKSAGWVAEQLFSKRLRTGVRVYAYRIASYTGPSEKGDALLGSVMVDRRNLGKTHTYTVEHENGRQSVFGAVRVRGGGTMESRQNVRWDDQTIDVIDLPVGVSPEIADKIRAEAWAAGRSRGLFEGRQLADGSLKSAPPSETVNPYLEANQ